MSRDTAPVRSMTGYARVRKTTPLGEVTFALKSVNHRGLDLHFNLTTALDPFEGAMRTVLKRRMARGHVELRVHLAAASTNQSLSVNQEMLNAYIAAFKEAARQHRLGSEPDLNAAFRVPGMLSEASPAEPDAATEAVLVAGLEETCDRLDEFRIREGLDLRAEMLRRQTAITDAARRLEGMRGAAVAAIRTRLDERLAEISIKLDPQRIAQEAALLAERSDIAEEIARLGIHVEQLGTLLENGGEVGKKIDFLLQEMNRETNTILSKTSNGGEAGLEITHLGLQVKSDIEKIREQSLNVE